MKKLEINRFLEMETFVRVVELGGFSATAKFYRKSPSAISKLITRLESRLNTRLFNRSTRGLQITEEGRVFYEHSLRALSGFEEAERSVGQSQVSSGHLRVTANVAIGRVFLLPIIPEFIKKYPNINLDLTLVDKVIDLMGENMDVAIRSGPMKKFYSHRSQAG
jgi:DNA-binding transcriptional LysR family regulator